MRFCLFLISSILLQTEGENLFSCFQRVLGGRVFVAFPHAQASGSGATGGGTRSRRSVVMMSHRFASGPQDEIQIATGINGVVHVRVGR